MVGKKTLRVVTVYYLFICQKAKKRQKKNSRPLIRRDTFRRRKNKLNTWPELSPCGGVCKKDSSTYTVPTVFCVGHAIVALFCACCVSVGAAAGCKGWEMQRAEPNGGVGSSEDPCVDRP
jgi:hypothetical protein